MNKEFEKLISETKKYLPDHDIVKIKKVWEFAKLAHSGQKRMTGHAYATHPLAVARILAGWRLDATSINAGLLHDTIEDGGALKDDLCKDFGEDVCALVDGVTKVGNIRLKGSHEEEFVENLRKMFLAMAKDLRVVLVKLADRLHNMRTLDPLPKEKQKKIAKEKLEIFAPLAERLGISEVAGELEDLAFSYVYPRQYQRVKNESAKYFDKTAEIIKKMKGTLSTELEKEGVKAMISGRRKGLYSLWRKLERPGVEWDFEKVKDIIALRVIVSSVKGCYSSLGVVHNAFKPVPHLGISDYIAQPKPNGYRSIHTKVFGPGGRIVEIQIRTTHMHEHSEYGVAAHWAYSKEKKRGVDDDVLDKKGVTRGKKLSWVQELAKWQKDISDSNEFLKAVKFDVFKNRNFVFSPDGDVYDLPVGATAIDFAYEVHTDLGKYIKGAKANDRIISLSHKLKSGDVVEIIKTKKPKAPSRRWLDYVVTTRARIGIKKQLRLSGKLDL